LLVRRLRAVVADIECKIRETEDERHTLLTPNGVALLQEELTKQRKLLANLKKEEEE